MGIFMSCRMGMSFYVRENYFERELAGTLQGLLEGILGLFVEFLGERTVGIFERAQHRI